MFMGCLLPCLSFPFVLSSLYDEGFTELALYRVLYSVLYIMWGAAFLDIRAGGRRRWGGSIFFSWVHLLFFF